MDETDPLLAGKVLRKISSSPWAGESSKSILEHEDGTRSLNQIVKGLAGKMLSVLSECALGP